jgi:hypothetical protein
MCFKMNIQSHLWNLSLQPGWWLDMTEDLIKDDQGLVYYMSVATFINGIKLRSSGIIICWDEVISSFYHNTASQALWHQVILWYTTRSYFMGIYKAYNDECVMMQLDRGILKHQKKVSPTSKLCNYYSRSSISHQVPEALEKFCSCFLLCKLSGAVINPCFNLSGECINLQVMTQVASGVAWQLSLIQCRIQKYNLPLNLMGEEFLV